MYTRLLHFPLFFRWFIINNITTEKFIKQFNQQKQTNPTQLVNKKQWRKACFS